MVIFYDSLPGSSLSVWHNVFFNFQDILFRSVYGYFKFVSKLSNPMGSGTLLSIGVMMLHYGSSIIKPTVQGKQREFYNLVHVLKIVTRP